MKRIRRGVKRVFKANRNLSKNQYVSNGSYVVTLTHYKDGHYSMKINNGKAVRVNALTVDALVKLSDIAF